MIPCSRRFPDLECEGFPLHTQNVVGRRGPNPAVTRVVLKIALEQRTEDKHVLVLELNLPASSRVARIDRAKNSEARGCHRLTVSAGLKPVGLRPTGLQ